MAGTYYTFAGVQALDGRIAAGDQTTVDEHGATVDQEIENWLEQFTDSLPFESPEIVADINRCSNYETLARSLISIYHDYKGAEFWEKKYKEIKASIISRLKATDSTTNSGIYKSNGNQFVVD